MKRLVLRSLCICLPIINVLCLQGSLLGQLPMGLDARYAVERIVIPEPLLTNVDVVKQIRVDLSDSDNPYAIVVGVFSRVDVLWVGYIYDHFGTIDPSQPKRFYALDELPGATYPPAWAGANFTSSKIFGLNSSGLVTGYLRDPLTNEHLAFYLDINDPNLDIKEIPRPADGVVPDTWFSGVNVNELGHILVRYSNGNGSFVFDPSSGTSVFVPVDFYGTPKVFNSLGDVLGKTSFDPAIFKRYNYLTGITDDIVHDSLWEIQVANDAGQFAGRRRITNRRGKNKSENGDYVARYGSNLQFEWGNRGRSVYSLNLSGDLTFDDSASGSNPFLDEIFVLHEDWGLLSLGDLVADADPQNSSDPSDILANATFLKHPRLSNRDSTGFGWIACAGMAVGAEYEQELFILIPNIPEPIPGISVSPTSGLTSSESGGTATFEVVLDSKPNADVSIGISSDNNAEGTVDKTSLTYTVDNWDAPQTVTVTGVDDDPVNETSDDQFNIVIAAATSTDSDYDGVDADDVSVTNLDNDGPPGGSQTYFNNNSEAIPDKGQGVALSMINVPDVIEITSLTVTLDISHPRPSDLVAELTRGGVTVELPVLSGDNTVTTFDGTLADGDWFLMVTDNKKKKTGTLKSWSITVDY